MDALVDLANHNMRCKEQSTLLSSHFEDPSGEIYLSTTDGTTFRVSKSHLCFASEIFSDMFSAASPADDQEGSSSSPLLLSDIPAGNLNIVLHLVYATGVFIHIPTSLQLYSCAKFADKYVMDGLTRLLRTLLKPHITNDPMSAYMVASSLGWESETSEARVAVMRTDLFHAPFKPEWEGLPASHIHTLMVSYNRSQQKSRDVLADFVSGKMKVFWPPESISPGSPSPANAPWFARKYCVCNRIERLDRKSWPPKSPGGNSNNAEAEENQVMHGFPPIWARVLHTRLVDLLRTKAKLTSLEVMETSMKMGGSLPCVECPTNMAGSMNVVNALARGLEGVSV